MAQDRNRRRRVLDPDYPKEKSIHSLSSWWALFAILLILSCSLVSDYLLNHSFPRGLKTRDAAKRPTSFIAERAWNDLKAITDLGPRVLGTEANERLAVDLLKRQIADIQATAHANQSIELDHQVVSGAYKIQFMRRQELTNAYRNVQNLVVKLHGKSEKALMFNCHYDSVPGSPGASDDAANCCIMLEILRVLSRQPQRQRYSIIFLLNGAEESPLQASHGFITQHKWSKQVKAFINLESAGSGGKEILFQSGPRHPWLIRAYSKVPHPSGQAAGEEVFQSGIIPSDTDFRIFRDYGRVPGMDFAHQRNGYRYHTKYDVIKYMTPAVIQRTGDNALHLAQSIANAPELENTEAYTEGYTVFFDVLGLFFVYYSADLGYVINLGVVLVSLIVPFLSLARATSNVHMKYIRNATLIGFGASILAIGFSGLVCLLIGVLLDRAGHALSWYGQPILLLGVYCTPALLAQILVHVLVDRVAGPHSPVSLALKTQARLNGTNLLGGIVTLGFTLVGLRMGYITMVLLLFSVAANTIVLLLNLQNLAHKWLWVHVLCQIPCLLWTTTTFHTVIGLFVPMTGRMGGEPNPELIIGLFCAVLVSLVVMAWTPLVLLLRNWRHLAFGLFFVSAVTFSLIFFTNVGFPYRADAVSGPKVQRFYLSHTSRTFFDFEGRIRVNDSGYMLCELDRNSWKTIEGVTMPIQPIPYGSSELCETDPLCGLPIHTCRWLLKGGFWVPGPQPVHTRTNTIELSLNERLNDHEKVLEFTLKNNILTALVLRPKAGVEISDWSLIPGDPPKPTEQSEQHGFFVLITNGLDQGEPFKLTLRLKSTEKNFKGPWIDIVVTSGFWEHHEHHTDDFDRLLRRFPSWSFAVPAVSAMYSYTF